MKSISLWGKKTLITDTSLLIKSMHRGISKVVENFKWVESKKEYTPEQQSVIKEKDELSKKIVEMQNFFATEEFHSLPGEERVRQRLQIVYMNKYLYILLERIKVF